MLFVDDIILINEIGEVLGMKLNIWWLELESKGFRILRLKIEYLVCNFGFES